VEVTKQKEEKRGGNLSPRNRKACHNINTTLMKSVAEIGTLSARKSSRKTLHDIASHITQTTPKRNIIISTNEMMHTDRTIIAEGARVNSIHAKEATNIHPNNHQNSQTKDHMYRYPCLFSF
jgi:hypothetical protein